MRQRVLLIVLLLLLLTACGLLPAGETPTAPPAASASVTVATATAEAATLPPPAPPTATELPPTPEPTATALPTTAPAPLDLSLLAGDVFLYPGPAIYAGDEVTVQVLAHVPESLSPGEVQVALLVDGVNLATTPLNGRNLGGDAVGLFAWAWDTADLAGIHRVSVVLDPQDAIIIGDENPDNNRIDLDVEIQPAAALPAGEVNAHWITAETEYATIHVVSGTAAARDLEQLKQATDIAVQQASEKLDQPPDRKYDIYFIDRVLGQGGYAGSSIVVSYLDRDYAGGGLHEVLVHEITHLIDQQITDHRIPFLVEGVAVWVTGGHYKQENLDQRAAALRESGLYVPLPELINDFYPNQHEVGYLEGAGFINYLVSSYGWPATRAFYADVDPNDAQTLAEAVSLALQRHFGMSLAAFEVEWNAYLDRVPYDRNAAPDLLTTIRYYDLMRHYQLQYDPTAHFLQAWLPFPQELENRAIIADVTRHTDGEMNVILETMLHAVNTALMTGNYNRANALLDSVERILNNDGQFIDPIAKSYREIVRKLTAVGYRVQSIELNGTEATVMVRNGVSLNLAQLSLVLRNQNWVVTN
ncbi:MAG: hypothetical protein H6666_07300 [Ardenticatenaceae bacterium]|nr:hypothetical protein [Ardenticatenaceae bacterium]